MAVFGCGPGPTHNAFESHGAGAGQGEASTSGNDDADRTSGSSSPGPADAETGGAPDSEGSDDAGLKLDVSNGDADGDGGNAGDCECAPSLDAIYLLSDQSELWVYDPADNGFELLASLMCEQQHGFSGSTFSMGVSRDGFAWVQYAGGNLYAVDVNDPADCDATSYQAGSFGNFGMSFVSASATNPCDQIYGHALGIFGPGMLAKIDAETLQRTDINETEFDLVELSGTGDGRLFGLVTDTVSSATLLAEFDKSDGSTIDTRTLDGLDAGSAFAVAF